MIIEWDFDPVSDLLTTGGSFALLQMESMLQSTTNALLRAKKTKTKLKNIFSHNRYQSRAGYWKKLALYTHKTSRFFEKDGHSVITNITKMWRMMQKY